MELKGVSKNSASLTRTHPFLISFSKERGDADNSFYYCSPSLIKLERGNKKGVSKKREGRCESCFIQLFPLFNSIREGEIKGVSKNSASLTQFSTSYRWWLFILSPFGA
jgi:hypothetical protein